MGTSPSPVDPRSTFEAAAERVRRGQSPKESAQSLLDELTLQERLSLLDGDSSFWKGLSDLYSGVYSHVPYYHGQIQRLGIPGIRYCDGPRGVNIGHVATAFPVATARGATWDRALEKAVGYAIGLEARAQGANVVGSVCVNVPRHPAWGRVQECYGEDPFLLGELGAAHTAGLQRNVIACIKHFALNSMETARFRVNVDIDEAALQEVFLPQFKRCIGSGALSIMSAYNSVNGEWAGDSEYLLSKILRDQWRFEGFVISDWIFGVHDGVKSIKTGLDIEAPFQNHRASSVAGALESGALVPDDIDQLALRILATQLRFYATRDTGEPRRDIASDPRHRTLAREVANRSIVLLKNAAVGGSPILPLPPSVASVAVVGRLADSDATGDRASSLVHCPDVISPYQGIKDRFPASKIFLSASDSVAEAVTAASHVEYAVVVVGYDAHDEGEFLKPSATRDPIAHSLFPPFDNSPEAQKVVAARQSRSGESDLASRPPGGDRRSVRLRAEDVQLIEAVSSVNPRTIVSIVTAGAVVMEEWRHTVPAVLVGWYNGCEGGRALADVVAGAVNPAGRLPWSVPRDEAHLPPFDADADQVTYDKWHGQRLLDRMGVAAAYPLGFGLSYTEFELEAVALDGPPAVEDVMLAVRVANKGGRNGRCVVQVYGRPQNSYPEVDFPARVLVGFESVEVPANNSITVKVPCSYSPLKRWLHGNFVHESTEVILEVSQYSGDGASLSCKVKTGLLSHI